MSFKSLLPLLLGLSKTVIEGLDFDAAARKLVVSVRPTRRGAGRCPKCGRVGDGYDAGRGRRRWRCLDFGSVIVELEAFAPRIKCVKHGVLVARMPWARHGSWFTRSFEAQVAWLTLHTCRSVVAELMRVDWKTVGGIVKRVQTDLSAAAPSPLEGLVNIGIDETSYKKGQKYLTVVVDHDRNQVVWVAKGIGKTVLDQFFNALTATQKASIRCVTADAARWISESVAKHCPEAVLALDPFHTVAWATEALDQARRRIIRGLKAGALPRPKRGRGRPAKGVVIAPVPGQALKNTRYALLKNPANLTAAQRIQLEMIATEYPDLNRGWLLKEQLRLLLKLPLEEAIIELEVWLAWAQRCRIEEFVELGRKIKRHKQAILDTIRLGLTNARIEATNNKIKLIIRMGYGFRNLDNLIALILLKCGGLEVTLPCR